MDVDIMWLKVITVMSEGKNLYAIFTLTFQEVIYLLNNDMASL